MMSLQLFAIRDAKVGAFMTPSFMQSEGQAIRTFSDEINRAAEDNILYKHPHDFELYALGVWRSADCTFEMLSSPKLLVTGLSVKISAEDASQPRLRGIN